MFLKNRFFRPARLEYPLNKFIGEEEVEHIIGDFNVRIDELGEGSIKERDIKGHSKDKVVENGRRNFIE